MNEIKIENLTVKIEQDENPSNPRTEHDCASRMVCWHRRYSLGDEQPKESASEWIKEFARGVVKASDADLIPDEHIAAILKKHVVILPLYLYDHSGITMRCSPFSCGWDSGQVGHAYMTLDDARRNWMLPEATFDTLIAGWGESEGKQITLREATEGLIRAEVAEYDQYLTGDVWCYTIEDEGGNHLDSCCGFFGREYCETEARESADYYFKKISAENAAEKIEREAMECRDIVTA